jgi:hypothetical protein
MSRMIVTPTDFVIAVAVGESEAVTNGEKGCLQSRYDKWGSLFPKLTRLVSYSGVEMGVQQFS